jgi:type 1 glutamine amidotransferase
MNRALKAALGAAALLSAPGAASAASAALVDCPLRDQPYSLASPIIDLLLSPGAKTVIEQHAPGVLGRLPARFAGTEPPTFAAILSFREGGAMVGIKREQLEAIDRDLKAVPVTRADKVARCARYDTVAPKLTIPAAAPGRPRVLLFEKINGFRDGPSVDGAHAALEAMARRHGWAMVTTLNGAAFNPATLRQFDVVIWNNISGDVLTLSQRKAFQDWMDKGGGYVGLHGSAGDPVYFWDWYVDGLLGARFLAHPMGPQFQTAKIRVEDASHPAAAGLPREIDLNDEWYSFKNNPRATGSRVNATIDESTYKPEGRGMDLRMGDHPIAWSRCIGTGPTKGRMFYTAVGHRPELYSDPFNVKMVEQGVEWAAGKSGTAQDKCQAAR